MLTLSVVSYCFAECYALVRDKRLLITAVLLFAAKLEGSTADQWSDVLSAASLREAAEAAGGLQCNRLRTFDVSNKSHVAKFKKHLTEEIVYPLLLQNLPQGWPIMEWGLDGVLRRFGNTKAKIRRAQHLPKQGFEGPSRTDTTLMKYAVGPVTTDVIFENTHTPLTKTISEQCCRAPANSSDSAHAEVTVMLRNKLHGKPIFSMGHEGGGVGFHQHSPVWLLQVVGRKIWFLAPPNAKKPMQRHPCQYLLRPPKDTTMCTVSPSEVLIFPNLYHHATCNIDGLNLAIGWEGITEHWSASAHAIMDENIEALDRHNIPTKQHSWLLHIAVFAGHVASVASMLARRADPNLGLDVQNVGDFEPIELLPEAPPIFRAAYYGHVNVVQLLVKSRVPVDGKSSEQHCEGLENCGNQPMHETARAGHVAIAELLAARRANINARNRLGAQPIHRAVSTGHIAMLQYLLDQKADIESKAEQDQSAPIFYGLDSGLNLDVLEFLITRRAALSSRVDGNTPLQKVASYGHVATIKLLIKLRSGVEERDGNGAQSMHLAVRSGHIPAVETLFALRADLEAKDNGGFQPLLKMVTWKTQSWKKIPRMLKTIISLRGDVAAADRHGNQLLHVAAQRGELQLARALVDLRASVAAKNRRNQRPSQIKPLKGDDNAVVKKFLHALELDVNNEQVSHEL